MTKVCIKVFGMYEIIIIPICFNVTNLRLQAGSRRIIQFVCLIMLLQGIFNKFGAVFMIIPEPIVGGIFCVMFGLTATSGINVNNPLTSYYELFSRTRILEFKMNLSILFSGLSMLQYIDLNSARNLFILGLTLLFSLVCVISLL